MVVGEAAERVQGYLCVTVANASTSPVNLNVMASPADQTVVGEIAVPAKTEPSAHWLGNALEAGAHRIAQVYSAETMAAEDRVENVREIYPVRMDCVLIRCSRTVVPSASRPVVISQVVRAACATSTASAAMCSGMEIALN